jgi:hypothetical protein
MKTADFVLVRVSGFPVITFVLFTASIQTAKSKYVINIFE